MKKYNFEKLFYVIDRGGSFYSEHKTLRGAKKSLAYRAKQFPTDPPVGVAKITLVHRAVKK